MYWALEEIQDTIQLKLSQLKRGESITFTINNSKIKVTRRHCNVHVFDVRFFIWR